MPSDYLDRLRPGFPSKTEAELELMLAASRQLQKMSGLPAYDHLRNGMTKLFPSRDWHEWRETRVKSVDECISNNIPELSWMGSASSGKSRDMADCVSALWWMKPQSTSVYVTSPYDDATEKGIWSLIVEGFYEAKDNNPGLPGEIRKAQSSIVLYDRNPRSFIRKVSVDEVGKMKGKKAIDPNAGLIIIVVDELADFMELSGQNFLKVLANLRSNQNLLILTASNFTNVGDAFGTITSPDEKDIPGGFNGFDPDKHFRWRTQRGGLALRFDGLQSPNVKAGKDIYPYLTSLRFIQFHASMPGGLQSPDAMREVRSAPVTSLDEFTVTNAERIKSGRAYEPFRYTSDDIEKGAFCDSGLGGDSCVIQKFKLGFEALEEGGKRQILELWEPPFIVPIKVGTVPVEDQVAIGIKSHCEANGILPRNVGYDAALRPALAQRISAIYSVEAQAVDSNGPATSRQINAAQKLEWREVVDRLLSEYWFATASLIDSRQLRGLQVSPKGAEQLCTRRWERSGKKKKVQTKTEYKEMLRAMQKRAESPNESDAITGCVEMARRMGLGLEGVQAKGGSIEMILQMIKEREARTFHASFSQRTALPPGRLHAMKPHTSMTPGRLHRR